MKTVQKAALSLLITVVVFSGFAVLAFSGLFNIIETRFYNQRVTDSLFSELERTTSEIENYTDKYTARFTSILAQDYIKRSFLPNLSAEDINNRENLFQYLQEELSGFLLFRLLDTRGNIHYSTLPTDIREQTDFSIVYQRMEDVGDQALFERLELQDGDSPKIVIDQTRNQVLFVFPFYDTLSIFKGTAVFHVSGKDLKSFLLRQGFLLTGQELQLVDSMGFVIHPGISLAEAGMDRIREAWGANTKFSSTKTLFDSDSGTTYALLSTRSEQYSFHIGNIVGNNVFGLNNYLKIILMAAFFVTLFLLLFLILSLRQDKVVVLNERIKRFQVNFLREYVEKKENIDWNKWQRELGTRRDLIKKEIKRGIGKVKGADEKTVDSLIEKGWDEIIEVIGRKVASQPASVNLSSNINIANLEEALERVLAGGTALNVQYAPPGDGRHPRLDAGPAVAEPVQQTTAAETVHPEDFAASMKPVEVEEIDEGDDIEEIGDADIVEELGDADELEKPFALDTAGMKPVEVEDIAEGEDIEAFEEAEEIEEVEALNEVEEIEETGAFDELEELEEPEVKDESEEFEEAEILDEVEELEEIEELGETEESDIATVEEPSDSGQLGIERFQALHEEEADEILDVLEEISEVPADEEKQLIFELQSKLRDSEEVGSIEELDEEEIEEADDLEELPDIEEDAEEPLPVDEQEPEDGLIPETEPEVPEEEPEELPEDDSESAEEVESDWDEEVEELEELEDIEEIEGDEVEQPLDEEHAEVLEELDAPEAVPLTPLHIVKPEEMQIETLEELGPAELESEPAELVMEKVSGGDIFPVSLFRGFTFQPFPSAMEAGPSADPDTSELIELTDEEGNIVQTGNDSIDRFIEKGSITIIKASEIYGSFNSGEPAAITEEDGVYKINEQALAGDKTNINKDFKQLADDVLGGSRKVEKESSAIEDLFSFGDVDLSLDFLQGGESDEAAEGPDEIDRDEFSIDSAFDENGFNLDILFPYFESKNVMPIKGLMRISKALEAVFVAVLPYGNGQYFPELTIGLDSDSSSRLAMGATTELARQVVGEHNYFFGKYGEIEDTDLKPRLSENDRRHLQSFILIPCRLHANDAILFIGFKALTGTIQEIVEKIRKTGLNQL